MSVNATGLASAQAEVYASYKTDTSAKTESASKKNASAKADTRPKRRPKAVSFMISRTNLRIQARQLILSTK